MPHYPWLKTNLSIELEAAFSKVGLQLKRRTEPVTFEKPEAKRFIVVASIITRRIGPELLEFEVRAGIRCPELVAVLDSETKRSFKKLLNTVTCWGTNLGYLLAEPTYLEWRVANLEEILACSAEAVNLFATYGVPKCEAIADLDQLAQTILQPESAVGLVQHRFKPYLLALAGYKAEAVDWIRCHYLTEKAWDEDKKLGEHLLSQSMFI